MPCVQATRQGSVPSSTNSVCTPSPHTPQATIPPTPYVNQTAVDQHTATNSAPVAPRNNPPVTVPPVPTQVQVKSPLAPTSPVITRTKSKNGQGVKQTRTNKATTDNAISVCWRCGKPGHLKKDCPKPPFCGKCRKEGHIPAKCPLKKGQQQYQDQRFSNPANKCLHCGGDHNSAVCPTRSHQATPSTSSYGASKPANSMSPHRSSKRSQSTVGSTTPFIPVNNSASAPGPVAGNHVQQVTPQVSPNVHQLHNFYMPTVAPSMPQTSQFPRPPYFSIPFPPLPVPSSNVSIAHSAPASDFSAAITLMSNAVTQGNANTTAITDALQRTSTQFADALQ